MKFLLQRLAIAIPTLFVVIAATFFLMRAAPGGPFDGARKLSPAVQRNVEAKYGLDRPLYEQFIRYVGDVAQGDLGPSLKYRGKDVSDFIREGLPVSASIGLSALVLGLLVGVSSGTLAALRRHGVLDNGLAIFSVIGVCVPTFVTAPLLVLCFASTLGWLPTAGLSAGLKSYILPVIVLALPQIAIIARLTRAGMIEVLQSNYIRTARARGLSEPRIVFGHALRAATIPLVGYLGPACAGLITGSLVVEKIFGVPGLGRSFITAAVQRDYPLVMGVVIVYAVLILLLNLVSDLIHAALDPRVRL